MHCGSTNTENFVLSNKLKFVVYADDPELFGIPYLDMDADTSKPFISEDLEGKLAIKCDGHFYVIPHRETDLAKIAVEENEVSEQAVIGLVETIRKYLVGHFDLRVQQ